MWIIFSEFASVLCFGFLAVRLQEILALWGRIELTLPALEVEVLVTG